MAIDDQLATLLAQNAELFAAYEEWANGQIMLLAGTVDDPDSFNETGGKTGALGYYPVVNVSGQTIYVPSIARLRAIAIGGEGAEGFEELVTQVLGKLAAVDAATSGANAAATLATTKAALADEKAALAGTKAAAAQTVVDAGASILAAAAATTAARDAVLNNAGFQLVATDLAAGAGSKIGAVVTSIANVNAVGADLLLGAGSFIARAPQAAIDAQTARVGAETAAAAVTTTLGASLEVVAAEAGGVNYAVDYSATADGTAGSAVGTPPLTASGVAFSTVGGYAISGAGAAPATPAFLRATPNYATAIQTTVISPASGQTAGQVAHIGPLAYYTGAATFGYWAVNKDNGLVYFRRAAGGAVSSAQTFTTNAGALASWTLETRSLGSRQFSAVLIRPDGTRYGPYTYTHTADVAPAWGVAATGPALRIRSAVVSTNRSQVVRRVANAETLITANAVKADPNFSPLILGDRDAKWPALPSRGGVFDIKASTTESVLIDTFAGADGTIVSGARVPDYAAANLPAGYTVYGTMQWQIINNTLAPAGPYGDAYRAPGLLVSALSWPLSKTWLETSKGVELSFDISTTASSPAAVGAFFKTETGAFLIECASGGTRLLYRSETGTPISQTLADGYAGNTFPGTTRCVIRAYEGNCFIAQIGTTTLAWGFAGGLGLTYPKIVGAGVYVDPGSASPLVRIDNLKIGPVPAAGGSRFRSVPALPPPVSPKFTKQGVVFTTAQADTGRGVLNFSVVNMQDIAVKLGITPLDKYYAFYSPDHSTGDGGIFFATAAALAGPWTRRGAAGTAGSIFIDGAGRQTETPVVKYDPVTNRLLMTYHIYITPGVNKQQTKVAWSTDGQSWNIIDYIYPWALGSLASDHGRHTGYHGWGKDPLGVVPGWVGWSRMYPAVTTSLCCTTRSADGVHWEMDLLPTYFPFLLENVDDTNIIHNHGYATEPFAYQGQRLMVVAPFRAAAQNVGRGYLALVQLGDDMRNMSAQEVIPFPLTETEELAGESVVSGVLVEDNILYLFYQSAGGAIRLATADLTKGPDGLARHFGV